MITNIYDVSNPDTVFRKAKEIYGDDVELYFSTHKDKKYMIRNPETGKFIHFGAMGMTDYTKHRDEGRRWRFQQRNKKWKDADPYSPAFMAYYLLW